MKALVDVAVFEQVPRPVAYIGSSCGDEHISAQLVVHRFNATTEEMPLIGAILAVVCPQQMVVAEC